MGQEVSIGGAQPLSEQQQRFVEELLEHGDAERAKKAAEYSETTPTISILRRKAVENAIRAGCDAQLSGPLRVKAMLRLKELITNDKTPSATAFNAAKLIIERGDDDDSGGDKPLTEMTEEELMAVISRLEEARTARLIDVTPENGAHRSDPSPRPIENAGE